MASERRWRVLFVDGVDPTYVPKEEEKKDEGEESKKDTEPAKQQQQQGKQQQGKGQKGQQKGQKGQQQGKKGQKGKADERKNDTEQAGHVRDACCAVVMRVTVSCL